MDISKVTLPELQKALVNKSDREIRELAKAEGVTLVGKFSSKMLLIAAFYHMLRNKVVAPPSPVGEPYLPETGPKYLIRYCGDGSGRWRAGRYWTRVGERFGFKHFTPAEMAELRADPLISIREEA